MNTTRADNKICTKRGLIDQSELKCVTIFDIFDENIWILNHKIFNTQSV